jgi:hypothetical protein
MKFTALLHHLTVDLLSFAGSEDGEAETETRRAAKPLWRNDDSNLTARQGPTHWNRRMRTRMYGRGGRATVPPMPI